MSLKTQTGRPPFRLRSSLPRVVIGSLALAGAFACNALDEKQESAIGTEVLVIPVDQRPVETADSPPPPITGGSMLSIGGPGKSDVAVADPERDRVSLIQDGVTREVALESGDAPFRLTRDASGALYVVLRGPGQVAKVDLNDGALTARISVCAEPRGIDYDPLSDDLVVACAEGKLVRFKPDGKAIHSELALPADLRDVVVQGNRTYVSRFRSAEVLFIENDVVIRTVTPPKISVTPGGQFNFEPDAPARTMQPSVAWKMVNDPRGGVLISHQRAVVETIGIDPHGSDDSTSEISPATNASPYGGDGQGFSCDAIVQSALTQVDVDGNARSSAGIAGVVLPVDLAVSKDGATIALASAGTRDPQMPQRRIEFVSAGGDEDFRDSAAFGLPFGAGGLHMLNRSELQFAEDSGTLPPGMCAFGMQTGDGPTTSVAFLDDNRVVSLERQAAVLNTVNRFEMVPERMAELGGRSTVDTGHEIFHRDSGGGIACASCHPEAGDDGHVWVFAGLGPRRTQHLGIPLAGTAPFHWDGTLPTLRSLMDEVFVERMGGVFEDEDRLASLETWMFAREARRLPAKDEAAAARGEKLFRSTEAGCATCHAGEKFTDNQSYAVGTTDNAEFLQVPPLQGLLLRPPYMHNGCAKTLLERFDADCGGGDAHGKTSQLTPAQVGDLVSYLETL